MIIEKKPSSADIKAKNRQLIYHFIRENTSVSKQDIVFGLQLSLPTVTQNLQYLVEKGLIDNSEKIKNTGGRNATAYTYLPSARAAIGIYITEHHMNGVAVDLLGNEMERIRRRIQFNLEDDAYLRELGALVMEVKKNAGIEDEDLLGVGIAVPGLVSDDGESVIYGLTLNFTGKTLEEIAKYIPYPCQLCHDSYVAGYAEVWESREIQNAFYLSLSNSVGGSLMIDEELYVGDTHKSGEIGHMIIVPHGGKTCYCGKKGCLDTVCNAGELDRYTDGNLEAFFKLLEQGDHRAHELWSEYLDYLAIAVVNIRILFDSYIILGGYVGAYIDDYMEDLCRRVDERFPFDDKAGDYLLPCKYKVEATAAGAAIRYVDEFLETI